MRTSGAPPLRTISSSSREPSSRNTCRRPHSRQSPRTDGEEPMSGRAVPATPYRRVVPPTRGIALPLPSPAGAKTPYDRVGRVAPKRLSRTRTRLGAKRRTPRAYWGILVSSSPLRAKRTSSSSNEVGVRGRRLKTCASCGEFGLGWRERLPGDTKSYSLVDRGILGLRRP